MYKTISPPAHLRNYIDLFWHFEKEHILDEPFAFHAIAGSKLELIFFYDGDFVSKDTSGNLKNVIKSGFFGQSTRYEFYYPASAQSKIFGVRLNPITFLTLFQIPASEITNEKLDFSTIIGALGAEVMDRVASAKSFTEQTSIIISLVEKRMKSLNQKYLQISHVLEKMHATHTQFSVSDLMNQSYLSPRQFERNFKDLTGFSAKTYLKITRFEQLIEKISNSGNFSEHKLLSIALDVGYYDQAHLNHHFKEFTGVSPTSYFRERAMQSY
jgi:AraC-like DNA-binding protein